MSLNVLMVLAFAAVIVLLVITTRIVKKERQDLSGMTADQRSLHLEGKRTGRGPGGAKRG